MSNLLEMFYGLSPLARGLMVVAVAIPLLLPFLLLSLGNRVSGRGVAATFVGLFAVIIVVNLFMARQAIGTFPGLEVANSYVASQTFDADRAAQQNLGWHIRHDYADGVMSFAILDSADKPVSVKRLDVTVGRTTHTRDDQTPAFAYENGQFTAPIALAPGNWLIHLEAEAPDGTLFRQRFDFNVRG
ncbi:FixH family protein [Paracoccus sp. p4-l81]|uniref:FixH family protein n=1 Tax=unclassified Paracoccus (in: a-proteobacteria) TaxID=2688777 RepID=UPI0035BB1F30